MSNSFINWWGRIGMVACGAGGLLVGADIDLAWTRVGLALIGAFLLSGLAILCSLTDWVEK